MDLIINTDGASRGNPGEASYGIVIKKRDGEILHQEGKRLGINTNNFAEYTAILEALKYVDTHFAHKGPHTIEIRCDSLLAAQQLLGNYKIKNPILRELYNQIKVVEINVGQVHYQHVPREENFVADRLANIALDNR